MKRLLSDSANLLRRPVESKAHLRSFSRNHRKSGMQRLHPFADEKKGEVLRRAVFSIADFADTSQITSFIDRPIREVVGCLRFVALVFGAVA
jgi:hypothetical protein